MIYAIIFGVLILLINIYFKVADKFNIIDKPNERSLHTEITIRGGGIIFYFAFLCFFIYAGFPYPFFFVGLTIISLISFLDDIYTLSSLLRLGVHIAAIALMFYQWYPIIPIWGFIVLFIFAVGILNAYNFMDGINGITAVYGLSIFCTLVYINRFVVQFVDNDLLYFMILSLVVFNLYNFRKRARCFAGDIGSISLAFVIIFLLGKLVLQTQNPTYVLLLALYGIDSATTIFQRILRKENILKAHKTHLFQYMVDFGGWSHLAVSSFFGLFQVILNIAFLWVLMTKAMNIYYFSIGLIIVLGIIYLLVKKNLKSKAITTS